ncbi:MAG TPA: cupin domain-containing protein [Myxococcaceae bacterium]|nr:cupin domain-containing protein [Myxococcaceae bacterium]
MAALEDLKFRCSVIAEEQPNRPWTRTFPDDAITLHAVVAGDCLLDTDLPVWRYRVHEGEVLVVSGGAARGLRPLLQAQPPDVVSARVHLEAPLSHPLLDAFPRLIRASPGAVPHSFQPVLEALRQEISFQKLGRDAVVAGLCEVLFVHAVRAHLQDLSATDRGWLRMLADPLLREQLALASAPGATVAGCAAGVGRSRQRTRARFFELGATRPSHFLRKERMRRAAALLAGGETDLARIARATGYATRQGLCRAFRRELGVSPAQHWRAVHGRAFPRRRPRRPTPTSESS